MSIIRPALGQAVHVREGDTCRAGIVVGFGPDGDLRVRVLRPAPVTEAPGADDAEAVYPPQFRRPKWATPVDTHRAGVRHGDAWHLIERADPDCSRVPKVL